MKMAYEKRKSMYGYCFIALWFIGALIFFLIPVVESLFYSFREVSPDTGGMVGPFVGLDNYNYAFNVDPNYRQYLVKVLKDTALENAADSGVLPVRGSHSEPEVQGTDILPCRVLPPGHHCHRSGVQHHQRQPAKHRQQRCQPVFHHVLH